MARTSRIARAKSIWLPKIVTIDVPTASFVMSDWWSVVLTAMRVMDARHHNLETAARAYMSGQFELAVAADDYSEEVAGQNAEAQAREWLETTPEDVIGKVRDERRAREQALEGEEIVEGPFERLLFELWKKSDG